MIFRVPLFRWDRSVKIDLSPFSLLLCVQKGDCAKRGQTYFNTFLSPTKINLSPFCLFCPASGQYLQHTRTD